MSKRKSRRSPGAQMALTEALPEPSPSRSGTARSKGKSITPEQIATVARAAMTRRVSNGHVRITVALPRQLAEQLAARAIAEGRSLEDVAAEIFAKWRALRSRP